MARVVKTLRNAKRQRGFNTPRMSGGKFGSNATSTPVSTSYKPKWKTEGKTSPEIEQLRADKEGQSSYDSSVDMFFFAAFRPKKTRGRTPRTPLATRPVNGGI